MSDRIDADLRHLMVDAEELAEYVLENFEELSVGEQDIWLYGWPNNLAILEGLERACRAGYMSGEQERRYLALKAKLRVLAPEIERVLEMRAL